MRRVDKKKPRYHCNEMWKKEENRAWILNKKPIRKRKVQSSGCGFDSVHKNEHATQAFLLIWKD